MIWCRLERWLKHIQSTTTTHGARRSESPFRRLQAPSRWAWPSGRCSTCSPGSSGLRRHSAQERQKERDSQPKTNWGHRLLTEFQLRSHRSCYELCPASRLKCVCEHELVVAVIGDKTKLNVSNWEWQSRSLTFFFWPSKSCSGQLLCFLILRRQRLCSRLWSR